MKLFAPCRWGFAFFILGMLLSVPSHAAKSKPVHLEISTKGSELAFDKTTLSARAGQEIELTFTNKADPETGMRHLWVLAKPGTNEKVAAAGVAAGASHDFVPDSPDVIAHTRLLKAGQSDTIHFRAPKEPGDYPYMCTYPGHAQVLHGILKIEK